MSNRALGKLVEEDVGNPECTTDGIITGYTGNHGFTHVNWPGTLTVDLGATFQIICIRFLLWDQRGIRGGQRATRRYLYRLLTSVDHETWTVHYDTGYQGSNGWQVFDFASPFTARYVRLHGLWNSDNDGFHVVELEAHDDVPPPTEHEVVFQKTLNRALETEAGDGLPLEVGMSRVIRSLERLVRENQQVLNPGPFNELISQLRTQARDIAAIEQSMFAVRREIIEPVKRELEGSSRLGRTSLFITIVCGLLAVVSLVFTLWQTFK
ncbi:MAG TPA: discoidin domain-containing protein [Longimicrobium sp.]|jgi:hypothetical protein